MWNKIIGMAISQLFKYLDKETIKNFVDTGLDKIEDKYIEGEIDTAKEEAVRSGVALIRKLLDIDDAKYGTDKV